MTGSVEVPVMLRERPLAEPYEALALGSQEQSVAGLVRVAPESSRFVTPFRRIFSLDRLIDYWEKEARSNSAGTALLAQSILEGLERAPDLRGEIKSHEVLERHATLVQAMMTAVFPLGLRNHAFSMASYPGELRPFYVTPRFRRELLSDDLKLRGEFEVEDINLETLLTIFGSLGILRRVYGINFPFEKAIHLRTTDGSTGLSRYFQVRTHLDFGEVRVYGTTPELPPEVDHLRERVTDLELWRSILPPDRFAYYGFMVCDAIDVTEEVCISHLKQELVSKDPLTTPERLLKLQSSLRSLLGIPDLFMTIAGIQGDEAILITPCAGRLRPLDLEEQEHLELTEMTGCQDLFQPYVMPDLARDIDACPFLRRLHQLGYRSALMAPFGEEQDVRGILTLASHQPGILDSLAQLKINPLLPLLSVAMGRTTEGRRTRVQAIMKEQFTAIHPAIEWRFQAAALQFLQTDVLEEVRFPEVYPLFGASDIRGSSVTRNNAIRTDLLDQLKLADRVLEVAHGAQQLPFLDHQRFRLQGWVDQLQPGLNSGSETRIIEFLKHDIEPMFARLESFAPEVRHAVESYREELDPELGFLYRRRREFEESVGKIRDCITGILYEHQAEAQKAFPHYFEMYKTDGVDHTMYLGPSTVQGGGFDLLFLRNLRLWQLLVMVEVARATRALVGELTVPLETAHLILAHDQPLSIRFQSDEKQFNVDGAYNARYEIVKKRLDKAEVDGTNERITQPGKVAVVYSHPREATEYREYFEYLRGAGQVEPLLEELNLGPLQGVQGLKALRMTVR